MPPETTATVQKGATRGEIYNAEIRCSSTSNIFEVLVGSAVGLLYILQALFVMVSQASTLRHSQTPLCLF